MDNNINRIVDNVIEEIKVINESSLNRIVNWMENNEIAMVTAFRGKKENIVNPDKVKDDGKREGESYSHKENRERNRELGASLYRLGYGVTKISGVYVENFGTPNERLSNEESFLVVNLNNDPNFYNNIFALSEYYNQDCFCYKPKDENVGYNIGTNGADYPSYGNKERNGKFIVGVKNEFMSRLGNKGFAFSDSDNLQPFGTTHGNRKQERIGKKIDGAINEEIKRFSDWGIGAKQVIAKIGDNVINEILRSNSQK